MLVVLGALAMQRAYLTSHRAADAHAHTLRGSFALFRQAAILACFGYFVVQTTAGIGMQTFAGSALNAGFSVPLALANSAVTAYLLGRQRGHPARRLSRRALRSSRSDCRRRPARRFDPHRAGCARIRRWRCCCRCSRRSASPSARPAPSRDLIVRSATPKGASGRVYGFVYSGLDVGATLGPLWFGLMLDHGLAPQMFIVVAVLLVVAIMTVLQARRVIASS